MPKIVRAATQVDQVVLVLRIETKQKHLMNQRSKRPENSESLFIE